MCLHIRMARLPGLEVEIDLQARLVLADRVRNGYDKSAVVLDPNRAIDPLEELDELLADVFVYLNSHRPPYRSLCSIFSGLSNFP